MKTNVRFKCKVAIGIGGMAVLDLIEWCDPDWCVPPGTKLECVKEDILMDGAEEWAQHTMADVPVEHGIYDVTGSALFTEDESMYGGVVFEGV